MKKRIPAYRVTRKRYEIIQRIMILTDGKETDYNYFNGIKEILSEKNTKRIQLKILRDIKTQDLISTAKEERNNEPNYYEVWLVLDCDQRASDLDRIVSEASKADIHVGWSNPCIEIFFACYFGSVPSWSSSKECISKFKALFLRKTKMEYKKNDRNIYPKLRQYGNEKTALKFASQRTEESRKNSVTPKKVSSLFPGTHLFVLVNILSEYCQSI